MIKYLKQIILSVGLCLLFIGCGHEEVDYNVSADWIYINGAEQTIEVKGTLNFTLKPQESYTLNESYEGGPESTTEESYLCPFDPRVGEGVTKIIIDGKPEITVSGGIIDRESYTAKRISARHFEFTYTFTDADFVTE